MTNLDKIKNKISNMNAEQLVKLIKDLSDCKCCYYHGECDIVSSHKCDEGHKLFLEADENYELTIKHRKLINFINNSLSECNNENELNLLKDRIITFINKFRKGEDNDNRRKIMKRVVAYGEEFSLPIVLYYVVEGDESVEEVIVKKLLIGTICCINENEDVIKVELTQLTDIPISSILNFEELFEHIILTKFSRYPY